MAIVLNAFAFENFFEKTKAGTDYIDLGTYGELYPIAEKDLLSVIEEGAKDINKTKIMEDFRKSSDEYFNVESTIPKCEETLDRDFDPSIVLKEDINLSEYGVFVKAGEKFNPLANALLPSYLFFIDENREEEVLLLQEFNRQIGGDSQVMVIVTGGEMMNLKHITNEIYKADKALLESLNPTCTPSIYVQQGESFLVRELALSKREDKNEK